MNEWVGFDKIKIGPKLTRYRIFVERFKPRTMADTSCILLRKGGTKCKKSK